MRTESVRFKRDPERQEEKGTYRLISFEENYTTTLVTCSKVVACRVELDGGYDVG